MRRGDEMIEVKYILKFEYNKLEEQIAKLEKELDKQKELTAHWKNKAERLEQQASLDMFP